MSTITKRINRGDLTIRQLAELSGLTPRQIANLTSEPRSVYLSRAEKRHNRIRTLRAQGLTMQQIAEQESCSIGTVHYALNKQHK